MRTYLTIASLTNLLIAAAAVGPAVMSPMLFDAPGTTEHLTRWIVFLAIAAIPIVAIAAAVVPWFFRRRLSPRTIVAASLFAFVWVAVTSILFLLFV